MGSTGPQIVIGPRLRCEKGRPGFPGAFFGVSTD